MEISMGLFISRNSCSDAAFKFDAKSIASIMEVLPVLFLPTRISAFSMSFISSSDIDLKFLIFI